MAVVKINGSEHEIDAPDHMPLLWAIRDFAELNGTKYGCGTGLCGSCTVHIDGVAVRSCQTAISEVQGAEIVTIEGLDPDGEHPVQQAWRDQKTCLSVDFVRPDRSCRRQACWHKIQIQVTRKSLMRWQTMSVDAAVISESSQLFVKPRREPEPC